MATVKKNFWTGKNGPLMIAEIGGNHEGSFINAKKLTNEAIKSGADVIKFQLYTGDAIVNKKISPDRNKHFKKFQLSQKNFINLANYTKKKGMKFISTPLDIKSAIFLNSIGKEEIELKTSLLFFTSKVRIWFLELNSLDNFVNFFLFLPQSIK